MSRRQVGEGVISNRVDTTFCVLIL
jgi:hypothetical protein